MEAAAVLGIFSNSYLYWDHEVNETNNRPRLEELATQAVTFLKTKALPIRTRERIRESLFNWKLILKKFSIDLGQSS